MNPSVIIPTHERPEMISNLVNDLTNNWNISSVIVIDTSNSTNSILKQQSTSKVKYVYLDSNEGISHSRNLWLSLIDSEYVIFMDDDFRLNESSNIPLFQDEFQDSEYDILGWAFNNIGTKNFDFHWEYLFSWTTLLHFVWLPIYWTSNRFHVIHNYFISKTQTILDLCWWDEELRFAREHDDFFLRSKDKDLAIGYNPSFSINHHHSIKHYESYDQKQSIAHFCWKWSIESKLEIRYLLDEWGKPYLSIVRFMWDKDLTLSDHEVNIIYEKYWLDKRMIQYRYIHFPSS